ncbi:MAG: hypothetical protein JSV83_09540 [Desulfobacterales bacterium]|nr:MAG: hypothetical protein JSV83_09540 [Desulfobacterales bacterium]
MMKKNWIITFFIFFSASIAAADEIEQAFSGSAPQEVVESTRQLIQSDINRTRAIDVTRAMLQNRFKAQQILKAHKVMMSAYQQGVPLEPIISKAFEGMSKQVQPENIVRAMERVQARYASAYRQARRLTDQKTHLNQMGHIIAAGMSAGMNEKSIEMIVHELQQRSREMKTDQRIALALETFKTARDMARLGVSSPQTVSVVNTALQHQFSAPQMQAMRDSFLKDSRTTVSQRLAKNYAIAIQQGKSFGGSDSGQIDTTGKSEGSSGDGGPGGGGGSDDPGGPGDPGDSGGRGGPGGNH